MSASTTRRPLRLALTPALLVSVLALSACGGSDDSTTNANANAGARSGSGTTTEQRSGGDNRQELQACLKKQGVELPERPSGVQGGERPEPPEGGARPEGGTPPDETGGLPGGGGAPAEGQGGEGRRGGAPFGDLSDDEREKLQTAMEKCGGQTPGNGGNGRGGPGGRQRPDVTSKAYQKSINAYVACVRKNGYDLPDPDFSGDGPVFDAKKVDQQDATFKKASAACQSELRSSGGRQRERRRPGRKLRIVDHHDVQGHRLDHVTPRAVGLITRRSQVRPWPATRQKPQLPVSHRPRTDRSLRRQHAHAHPP